ncbi:AmmeMemoRadiSam system radical SAM enzyme [Zhaonella formicivorans]|uniref:AmmeMemoRadiSam system radical SAM enzyme n=1 Tax=Zhaonella formicivorans TaxID=2528593 RepID=UPI0010E7AC9E|nr:AmmeMemoRadiSam system radical SAM enzyme [Zhaonella formicivorans]
MREAKWYEKLEGNAVLCRLCPHGCRLEPGKTGICRVRTNVGGRLETRNYGLCTSLALDPIEKKPLYHFYPGKNIVSLGTVGCNLQCAFCQNWHLAHGEPGLAEITPRELVQAACQVKEKDSIGIAYTYSEPTVWYEFVLEAAEQAKSADLQNVLVTNGFINEEPLKELAPVIDALNIDVKGFSTDFYRKIIKGDYRPVLRTAELAKEAGCHVEITTLLITGLNDGEEEIKSLVEWLAGSLGADVPLHFSRYFPNYQMEAPPTPLKTLQKAREIAREKLHFVYIGNAPELDGSDTYCPKCGRDVISRSGYRVALTGLKGKECKYCGEELAIVGV